MRHEPQTDPAPIQLAQLRADFDVRLSALESALADPAQTASLAGLILDLARVATEEAKAAAATAYLDAKREGDARAAQARAEGQSALEAERAANADLRRRAESAAPRIDALERKESHLAASVAKLEEALERAREDAARVEHDLANARGALDRERETNAALRQAAERAASESESRTRENANIHTGLKKVQAAHKELQAAHKELQAAHDDAVRQLAHARQAAADLRQSHASAHADLDAARASTLELRQVATRAADMSETLVREKAEIQVAHDLLKAELDRERAAAGDLHRALTDMQSQLEAARRDLVAATEREHAQQASASTAQALASHESLQRELEALRLEIPALKKEVPALQQQLSAAEAEASLARAELDEAHSRIETLESQRGPSAEWRQAAERAEQKIAKLIDLQNDTVAKTAVARRDLAVAQAEASSAKAELEKVKERVEELETERESTADLRKAVEHAEQKLASVTSVQVQTLANYEKLEKELAATRQDAAVLRAKLTRFEKAGKSKLTSASEQEWEAIRLAARCVLREPVAIEVNDVGGLIIDLSVDGCQILVSEAVSPTQVLKLVLPAPAGPILCSGRVAWVRPEATAPGEPASFRAGVAFTKPDVPAIEAFMAAHID